jgi:D-alanyl-lipoteichoic acid acyltransferase DltB (MBOAT superfamily)
MVRAKSELAMLFNSLEFAVFLPLVFAAYWLLSGNLKWQNLFVTGASYLFYGWWDWRFLILIALSTIVDYTIGVLLASNEDNVKRKWLLVSSLFFNLGLLGVFKYYNFFIESFSETFRFFGFEFGLQSISLILPVGISFYTFQTLSYTIDVYKRIIVPTKSFLAFAAYVSFFPQLVAGPIEKASNLLPQFLVRKSFDSIGAKDGLKQILWGLVKKMLIADNCAYYANLIFDNYDTASGSTLFLGAVFFAFQIYGDFSGYTDIAIGTAKLFGIRLKQNFAFPYFSRDMAEFWRRWHISLSSWFKEYIYIPLGGSRFGKLISLRNTMIIFLVSGFWHGANWTFVFWGALNALYFIPLMLRGSNRKNVSLESVGLVPSASVVLQITRTFTLTVLAWILFRADTLTQAFEIYGEVFSASFFTIPFYDYRGDSLLVLGFVLAFVVIEWIGKNGQYAIEVLGDKWPRPRRWAAYYVLIVLLFSFHGKQQDFIYFQF